jgi:hypothetical protein
MKIKTQGGKVITKDGKVSCTCCEELGCCMYPADRLWPGSSDPNNFFTLEDLPDTLELQTEGGIFIYEKDIQNIEGLTWKLYQSQEDAEDRIIWNPDEIPYGTLGCIDGEGPRYAAVPNVGGVGCCLVDENSVFQDQFADTYTVTWSGAFDGSNFNVVVTRVSLCVWEGVDPCGKPIYLFYGDNLNIGGGGDFAWGLYLNNYASFPCFDDFTGYIIGKDSVPPSYQNTPIGYYIETFATDATVS